MTALKPSVGRQSDQRLKEGSLSSAQVVFQSITHGAPAVSLAFSIVALVPLAGPAVPFTLVLAMVAVLFVAVAIGQMAKEIPSAGGLYTYAASALGQKAGFMVGWLYLIFEPWLMPLLLLLGATFMQNFFQEQWHVNTGWVPWVFAIALVICLLSYRNVQVSMVAGIVLAVVEVGSFVALAITMIIVNHDQNTLQVFNPANAPGGAAAGIPKALVFAVVAFIGFEGSAALGEEARDGRRYVPRSLIIGVLSIGVFYIFLTYAWVVGTGFHDFVSATTSSVNPFYDLARKFWSGAWVVIFIGLMTGIFGNANAGMTTGPRLMFAMGRNGVLPRALGRTHPRFHTPTAGILVELVFGVTVTLILGVTLGLGQAVGFVGLVIGIAGIAMYIIMCVSCVVYYLRFHRDKFNPWLHAVMPILGACGFVAAVYYQYHPLAPFPLRWALIFDPVWIAAGFVVMFWLARNRPSALADGARVFVAPRDFEIAGMASTPSGDAVIGTEPAART
jgi:amino acid transporter